MCDQRLSLDLVGDSLPAMGCERLSEGFLLDGIVDGIGTVSLPLPGNSQRAAGPAFPDRPESRHESQTPGPHTSGPLRLPSAQELGLAPEVSTSLPLVIGEENRLVSVAVDGVLEGPPFPYNPLVIHGPVGVGKSHLAHGMAVGYQSLHPDAIVMNVNGVEVVQILSAWQRWSAGYDEGSSGQSQANHVEQRRRMLSAQVLVIEDLRHVADKPQVQQSLTRLIDHAIDLGHQLIVTDRENPTAHAGLSLALRTRLQGGLCLTLANPGAHARYVLLKHAVARWSVTLEDDAAALLASSLDGTPPRMQGAIAELVALARPGDITLQHVHKYLAELQNRQRVAIAAIARRTSKYFSVKLTDLRGPSRRQSVVNARAVAMFLCRQMTGKSLEQIGAYFGGRDHTTVLHNCRKTAERLSSDQATRQAVEQLRRQLHS